MLHPASLLLFFAMSGPVSAGDVQFTDVTATAGVALTDQLIESVSWGDYDNDGDEDLYLTGSGPNHLFRNDGNDVFTEVTDVAGVGNILFGVGTAFGDLDNDGDLDLYVVNFGAGADALFRNNGPVGPEGEYVFTDITQLAGTTIERSSRGMAYIDYDRDGLLDIYVNAIGADILYHNLGDLVFIDVAGELGTDPTGQGVGVVATDCDQNGWIDLYNGNRSFTMSNLFMNTEGVFADVATSAGITASGLGMGVIAFDYDNDLDIDLYWTVWPGANAPPVPNRLYRNDGDGSSFTDVTTDTGTADPLGWGISVNAGDIDNDRWMDFFVTNGFSAATTPSVLFRNRGGVDFEDVSGPLDLATHDGRGVAFADYDGDGDLDFALTGDAGDGTFLFRNDTINDHHWLTVKLVGRASNRTAIGARVELTADGITTVNEVSGGAGRGSCNSPPLEFGLGTATTVDGIFIRWPSGRHQVVTGDGMDVDAVVVIEEPAVGDLDDDGDVDFGDLLTMLSGWGACGVGPCLADVDADGVVGFEDLLAMLSVWG